jgi:HK97 family phage prohead protease
MTTETTARFDVPMHLKALHDDSPMLLEGVASSSLRDLGGDSFAVSALTSMKAAFDSRLIPVLMDHARSVDKVFGKVVASSLTAPDAKGIVDLSVRIQVSESNPLAQQVYSQIKNGEAPISLSVGCIVLAAHSERIEGEATLVIDSCELVELSVVSAPAQPRSRGLTAKAAALYSVYGSDGDDPGVDGHDLDAARVLVRFLLRAIQEQNRAMTELREIDAEIVAYVNRLKDAPLPRKIVPEANFNSYAERFPHLDPRILNALARDKGD